MGPSSSPTPATTSSAASLCRSLLVAALLAVGCSDDAGPDPIFPADYASTFMEVRDCRASADHDLNNIRVLADPVARGPYLDRNAPFPEGATLVKEEYDFADDACTGEIIGWTAMVRLPLDSSLETLDWRWQRLDADRKVESEDDERCFNCHVNCVEPDGYESTCAVP